MPIEHVPFTALAQIALSSVRLSNIRLGHTVVIFGQGLIGNLAAQLMKTGGARKVIGIDPILQRLKISTQCGIDLQINPVEANVTESIDQITSGKGCQIAVEATGRIFWGAAFTLAVFKIIKIGIGSKHFGPIILSMKAMLKDIFMFLITFFVIMLAFSFYNCSYGKL